MVFQSYDVLHCIVGERGMSYSCLCHMLSDVHRTGQPECPPWFALVVCLVEGGGGVLCVSRGRGNSGLGQGMEMLGGGMT